jgi:uncharacterized protein (TIGR02246 family)
MKLINRLTSSLLLVFVLATAASAYREQADKATGHKQQGQSTKGEEDVRKIEQELAEASKKGDVSALDRLYADDVIVIFGRRPVIRTKSDILAGFKDSTPRGTIESSTLDVAKIRLYGDTAIVTGRFSRKSKDKDGNDTSADGVFTDVWVKRKTGWQLVSSHNSPNPKDTITTSR